LILWNEIARGGIRALSEKVTVLLLFDVTEASIARQSRASESVHEVDITACCESCCAPIAFHRPAENESGCNGCEATARLSNQESSEWMSEIEGKVTRGGASEFGQRASFQIRKSLYPKSLVN
jgi:hypothetical protein